MKLKKYILSVLCTLATLAATVEVNSTCNYHFYQEKLSPKLTSLKKYHEEESDENP